MSTVSEAIQQRITASPLGVAFTAADFRGLGSRAAVAQTLKRLADRGEIARVRRGLYVRPRTSRFVGPVLPDAHQIVRQLARRHNETVQVAGAEAARRLGLSTQVPLAPTYWTSGSSRSFYLGNLEVRFRHVSPRKLILAGRPAGDALAALHHLGRAGVTLGVLEQLEEKLPPGEFQALRSRLSAMPAWMAEALRRHEAARA